MSLQIHDVAGKLVRELISGQVMAAGDQEKVWDGTNSSGRQMSTGVYFYKLPAGNFSDVKRMALVK